MLEVRMLGRFEVRFKDKAIDIASRPAQSLLAYLILNAGSWHRREMLAGLLWPVSSETNARNNLRQALWRIRKALNPDSESGEEYLIADNFTIGFNSAAPHWVDAFVLDQRTLETWTSAELSACLDLYVGELLPGFYEDWVVLERERLHSVFENKMHLLLDRLLQEQRWRDVLHWSEHWIALGEAPEPAYRALMISYYHLGDASNMAASYQRCKEALRERLGVEISHTTVDLYKRLSSGEPITGLLQPVNGEEIVTVQPQLQVSRPPRTDSRLHETSEGEITKAPFVARLRELEKLGRWLSSTMDARGQVAVVTGISGSGKSALINEFADRAQADYPELVVAAGSCNSLTGIGDPYLPFREILSLLTIALNDSIPGGLFSGTQIQRMRQLLPQTIQVLLTNGPDLVDTFVPGRALISMVNTHFTQSPTWLPHLERLVERNAALSIDIHPKQKDLFEQYTHVMQALSHHAPLLLVLDDLQWADIGSVGLLFHLGRRIQENRIMLLCAFRPLAESPDTEKEQHPLLNAISEFKRTFGDIQIDLSEVEDRENQAFIDDFLDTEPNQLGPEFRKELFRHTGGHPLFTIELLRAMEDRGDIVHNSGGLWVTKPNLNWSALPGRVEGVVEERMRRLGEELQEVLTVASVEGEKFSAEVAAIILDADIREIVSSLSRKLDHQYRLVVAEGIRRLATGRLSEYRFRHILFQKHIYNRLDSIERAHLHEHVGNALEELYGEQAAEIAVQLACHFDTAGIPEKTMMYLQIAAERAKRLSANEEAVHHLERALNLLKTIPVGPNHSRQELSLQTSLGFAKITTKGYGAEEVELAFTRAHQLSAQFDDHPQHFSVLYGLRSFYLVRGRFKKALDLSKQLLRIAQTAEDIDLLIEAHQAMGTVLFFVGEFEESRKHLEACLEMYDLNRHRTHALRYGQDPGVTCLSYLALVLWCLGYPEQSLQKNGQALALAKRAAHPFSMALALNFSALFNRFYRDVSSGHAQADEAQAISKRQGFPFWLSMSQCLQGVLLLDLDKKQGIKRLRQGLASWKAIGTEMARAKFLMFLGWGLAVHGEVDEGMTVIQEALDEMERTGDRLIEAELHRTRGEILRLQDAPRDDVEACFLHAIEIAQHQKGKSFELRAVMSLCRLHEGTSKQGKAHKRLAALYESFTEGFASPDLQEAKLLIEGMN